MSVADFPFRVAVAQWFMWVVYKPKGGPSVTKCRGVHEQDT